MAELTIPFARRSGAVATAHLITGMMARCAGSAFAGFAKRMAARRTIAQLRALDDRTLHDIGLHRSEIARSPSMSVPTESAGATIERELPTPRCTLHRGVQRRLGHPMCFGGP